MEYFRLQYLYPDDILVNSLDDVVALARFFPNKNIDIGFFSDKYSPAAVMEPDIESQLHGDAFAFPTIEGARYKSRRMKKIKLETGHHETFICHTKKKRKKKSNITRNGGKTRRKMVVKTKILAQFLLSIVSR